ncbi:MAG: hypothetical protein OXB93_00195 [Cytophagales bacterium]|nr:hypothetical protein [Cytophagales bacterium]
MWQRICHVLRRFSHLDWTGRGIGFLYIPALFYFLCRHLVSNPISILLRVNIGESFRGLEEDKHAIYGMLDSKYVPHTLRFSAGCSEKEVLDLIGKNKLSYPLIFKPNIGLRGLGVQKILSREDIGPYLASIRGDILVQAYIDFPMEIAVFYYRYPHQARGRILSLYSRKPLFVRGDGVSTVRDLLLRDPYKYRFLSRVREYNAGLLDEIPPASGTDYVVLPMGNHSYGAQIQDLRKRITPRLEKVIGDLSRPIRGFHVGRFDIKCRSLSELEEGKAFKVLELNGVCSEQGHIYEPGYGYFRAMKDLIKQLRITSAIAQELKNTSILPPSREQKKRLLRHALNFLIP